MAEMTLHDLELPGCTPEPLMAYLKALGILRLVSEQKDGTARGWWRNDTFWLRSALDHDALITFFVEEYRPTPIVAPWAGGSGFFKKDNKEAVQELASSVVNRLALYREVIHSVRAIVNQEGVGDKPTKADKARLIRRYRRELPDEVVAWMDSAMVLQHDGQGFAPLLGTGGNDGRLDFTQNFMQRIVRLGLHKVEQPTDQSREWLALALFASRARLDSASVGQFAPGRAGGPNATQGMEGDAADNPWDFVLMLEGTLMLGGAAVRRFGIADSARAGFPFTVSAIAAGFDSAAWKDAVESRGELWLPLWKRPASAAELRQLFGEGRAEVSGRPARDGTDFARAVAGLGVDRGIAEFRRLAFLKRSGKAYLAAPLGPFAVVERPGVDLLREADPWLDRFRRAGGAKNAPPQFGSAVRRIDSAVFEFCKYGGAPLFQKIVVALGAAESALSIAARFRDEKKLPPLSGLSRDWIRAADDGSMEFVLARALASIHDPEGKVGPIRANLEAVDWRKRCRTWAERDRAVCWNAADLATNMVNILQRRLMDGTRAGCERLPIASRVAVPLETVAAFIAGELDDERIAELLWGLMLVRDGGIVGHPHSATVDAPIPRAYALLKLLFLPRPLFIERGSTGRPLARLVRGDEPGGVVIRPEPSILHVLCGDRLGEACAIAMRRLRASGLDPMPGPSHGGRVRDREWEELNFTGHGGIDPVRLAAALLIPIRDDAVNRLTRLIIRGDGMGAEQAETEAATNQ